MSETSLRLQIEGWEGGGGGEDRGCGGLGGGVPKLPASDDQSVHQPGLPGAR